MIVGVRNMRKLLPALALLILGCSFPVRIISGTPTQIPTLTPLPVPTQTLASTPEPGTGQNPLILALSPSPRPSDEAVAAGEVIAAFIEARTGYRLVTIAPTSESALVDALDMGNAHIAPLTPFGYLLARRDNSVTVILSSLRDGEAFYGAQFIVNRESEFTSYFDPARDANTAEAPVALKQFEDKKPCWSEVTSPSAYVIPLGALTKSQVQTSSPAFLEGQVNVVRAVYADDICDFGATFVDARELPSLEADYPDVLDRVRVAWRIPKVIPYEAVTLSNSLPIEVRRLIQRAFIDLMLTPEGKAAIQTAYGMDEIQVAEDAMYDDFAAYVKASGLDLADLIE
jgi:phosphonate transport system substrate-binding protein